MPFEGADFLACFYIPEYDSPVITTAHQSLAVGTKINASDRVIKLLALVKDSPNHLLLKGSQLRLTLRRERWLKLLLGHSPKQVQQKLSVCLLRLANLVLKNRPCNCGLPRGLSLLPGLLGRLISTSPLWIGFAVAWFIITGALVKASRRAKRSNLSVLSDNEIEKNLLGELGDFVLNYFNMSLSFA